MKRIGIGMAFLVFLASTARGQTPPGKTGDGIQHPRRGDFKDDFKDPGTGSLIMHYRMRVPEKLPEKKTLGLIVAFHGLNGSEDDMTSFAINTARRLQIADEYVFMGGKSKGTGWAETDDKDLLAWIAWTRETYPIDPRRIHAIGMSNGGWMVLRFGWATQDIFASISAYCGPTAVLGSTRGQKAAPAKGPMSAAETRTEWYLVHGDADTTVAVDSSRRMAKLLAQKGYRYVYREIDGADHVGIFRYPDVADDNLLFIHALRQKQAQLSKEERAGLTSISTKLRSEKGDAAARLIAEAAALGGPAGAVAIKSALGNADVEVKKAAIAAAENVLFSREIAMELVKLTRDKTADVKSAAFKSLGALANWRYSGIQDYLAQMARKKSLPVEDRAAAVGAMARAVKLMLLGWYEDKDLLWSLVLLLDDKEVKVREAAFAALKDGVKDKFEYKPDMAATERKASVARWISWCEQQAGPLNSSTARP